VTTGNLLRRSDPGRQMRNIVFIRNERERRGGVCLFKA
jgi:hypothetical protein